MLPIPTTAHNEALAGDTLYSAFLNYEWRELVVPAIVERLFQVAATIEDEGDRQDFEVRIGALIDDLYDEDNMDFTPVGTIVAFPSTTVPAKWRYCDGFTLLKADYPELYDIIGDTFTVPPDDDTFKLPDMRSKYIRGTNTGGGNSVGTGVGADTVALVVAELPAHTHTIAHTHLINQADGTGTQARAARSTTTITGSLPTTQPSTPDSGSTGSGAAHENRPASMHFAWMIKVLP